MPAPTLTSLARRLARDGGRAALAAVFLLGLQTPCGGMENLDLPLEHWAYEMLERFEVRASLGRTGLDTRPLRRGQVSQLVRRLEAASREGRGVMRGRRGSNAPCATLNATGFGPARPEARRFGECLFDVDS